MSVFDDMFDPAFFWDSEYRQRRDIQNLKQQIINAPDHGQQVRMNAKRIDQLELLCKALLELVVAKGLANATEMRVIMQQLDLADGVEDGRISTRMRNNSPRCGRCQRFVNLQRDACVYCGTPIAKAPSAPAAALRPDVKCSSCTRSVPESDTYFSGQGLVCDQCFDPNA